MFLPKYVGDKILEQVLQPNYNFDTCCIAYGILEIVVPEC